MRTVKLEPRTGGQPSRFAHDHPRCDSCRATEEAWQTCIVTLHRDRRYIAKLEHNLVLLRERMIVIYQALPSRRTKLARKVIGWAVEQMEEPRNVEEAHE